MTPKSFAVVACRLLAVWFFVQAMQSFVNVVSTFIALGSFAWLRSANTSTSPYVLFLAVLLVINLGASVVLWLGSSVFAESMARGTGTEASNQGALGVKNWQALGFSLIGMFVLVQGLTTLAGYFGAITFLSNVGARSLLDSDYLYTITWTQIAIALAQLLIGLALLLWAQKTIRVLDYLQRRGRDESSND